MAINLQKGQKVSLKKNTASGLGEILVNLNWNSTPVNKGFLSSLFGGSSGIDLDLGCLYELKDSKKGTVQALGNAFGSLANPPYIALDGDDRTGASAAGENLRIDGNHISDIKRILVYTFIYEGVANWQQADATVTIKYPGAEDIVVKMDTFNSSFGQITYFRELAKGKTTFVSEFLHTGNSIQVKSLLWVIGIS